MRYPPLGIRSYGPMRSALRIGPKPADGDADALLLVMIETPEASPTSRKSVPFPVSTVSTSDRQTSASRSGKFPNDPDVAEEFNAALVRIRSAADADADANGIVAAVHTASGEIARQRVAEGFTFVTIASDLTHLEAAAAAHLDQARRH